MISDFCNSIEHKEREYISTELRTALIEVNNGYFHISESEENLILFYKYRKQPYYKGLVDVLLRMKQAFNGKIKHLNELLNIEIDISLKFAIHYGKFSRQKTNVNNKLCGETVAETYSLMKIGYAQSSSYVLFSNSFLGVIEDYQYNITENKSIIPEIGTIYHLET